MQKKSERLIIDRSKTCPFLVRIFYAINDQNDLQLFKDPKKLPVQRQLQLHLWFDSSLRQICQLIKSMIPVARSKQRFKFSRVYCDIKQQWSKKQLGNIHLHKRSDKTQQKTLDEFSFRIGDYLDVSINYK